MIELIDFSALFTAFFAGVLGSGHCFGMCGGIAAGLGSLPGQSNNKPQALSALLFNLGRILSYAALGLISAWMVEDGAWTTFLRNVFIDP